ncbi:hypothetical protein ACU5AX_15590 [Sphingomonas sp. XXL09]|uniref:hypothetical protein n=1 Tax=Sphingomonas sp. XXL09 TaxID=3457787 RepID=UPI00406BAAF4
MLPIAAILAMALAVRTAPALAYPRVAALLFVWIACDALTLGLLAQRRRPLPRQVVATLAGGAVAAWLLSPAPLRAAVVAMPWLAAAMVLVVVLHAGVRLARVGAQVPHADLRRAAGWRLLLGEVLPPPVVRLLVAEVGLLHLAVFRWRSPADVPPDARGFAYHRQLAPMMIVMATLSVIEIGVTHLVVSHFSARAAMILAVIGGLSLLYLVGVIRSLRLRPVLLTPTGIHLRVGTLADRVIAIEEIAAIEAEPAGDRVRARDTLNVGLLAWPNLLLRLREPVPRRGLFGPKPPIAAIAFRLDDPAPFVRLIRWRLSAVG